jgi:hypothetical protein
LNPHDRLGSADFKSAVSADFTIRALRRKISLTHLNASGRSKLQPATMNSISGDSLDKPTRLSLSGDNELSVLQENTLQSIGPNRRS